MAKGKKPAPKKSKMSAKAEAAQDKKETSKTVKKGK